MRYYMETQNETNGLKRWLQARTTGLCMTWSRLLHFLVVRTPCGPVLLSNCFARNARREEHTLRHLDRPAIRRRRSRATDGPP